ncbi:ABC transporter ATP-binding protein [Amycolatopsis sp. EV170708-02-1]|uniref:ABC transporter ATP-binding protein n=1 Tax=Amycolatopsis sp. EV170708-02-1 TaxID=2919322 RepID=UPI001F0B8E45|nr:ABC transporter ATP-binding protein [Amycolatopsis sp. EV170708-02-1]UMP06860.1 ABC transporter ATP-binding protein/permease [Amycolatopsis sp. EV170708-02-1]
MIRDLMKILGPKHDGAVKVYLAWLVAYSLLQGLAMVSLVPVLRALLTGDADMAWRWLAVVLCAVIAACVARYEQAMHGFALSLVTLTSLHHRLGDHVASLPLGWFSSEKVGRLSRSATNGTLMVTNVTAHMLAPLVSGIVTPATVVAAMLVLDWRLGLASLLCAPVLWLTHRWAVNSVGRGEELTDAASAEAGNRVVEFARSQQVLRAFGRTTEGYRPLEDAIEEQKKASRTLLLMAAPRLLANGLGVQLAFAAVIVFGLMLAVNGAIDPVTLIALLALTARFIGPLAEVAAHSSMTRMAANDLRRLASIFDEKPLAEPAVSRAVTKPGEVELADVRFGYEPGVPVLNGISFRAPPRGMTAIVGPSGSGKSTITRLIMRFFDVGSGRVSVGGTDVRDQSTKDLMAQLSVVMQDVYLFDDTLEANIRVGNPLATDDEVREAARIAGVDEIVDRLPGGWSAKVGEGGASLSGGERQRVSVARAVLKDAPIVLLDEATAALDPENERYVQEALRTLMDRATLLVIAHKLSTVVAADQILVLDDGRIAESGTHEELLAANGRYTAFWNERRRTQGWRLVSGEEKK